MKTYCLEVSIHQNSSWWLPRILPPPPPHFSLYCTCPTTCTMVGVRFEFALTTPRNTDLVTFRKRYSSIPFFVVSIKNHDGALLKFHVRCATEFKKCYVEWRSPTVGFLVLCHPDTVRVVQSSNAPKAPTYNFVKPFIGMYVFFYG